MKHCFFFLLISSKAGKLFVIVNSFETQQLQKKSGYYQSVVNNGESMVYHLVVSYLATYSLSPSLTVVVIGK